MEDKRNQIHIPWRGTSADDVVSINLGPPTNMNILCFVCLKLYPLQSDPAMEIGVTLHLLCLVKGQVLKV